MKLSTSTFLLIIISFLTVQCNKKEVAPPCNLNTQALLGENTNLCSSAVVKSHNLQAGFETFTITVDYATWGSQVFQMIVPDSVKLGDEYIFAYGAADPLSFGMTNFDSDISGSVTITKIDRTSNLLSFKFEMFGFQLTSTSKAPVSIIGTITDLYFE